ncbi:hypothetical protein [Roseobacter sp. MH60115]|uniref:hypothetical protein n=1 Tax=Roseobacter sp. MH60115 TaxID=2785324 RepID=UPI0018A29B12|nr:hypothetical protein [Roseobacter sp. MH60115]
MIASRPFCGKKRIAGAESRALNTAIAPFVSLCVVWRLPAIQSSLVAKTEILFAPPSELSPSVQSGRNGTITDSIDIKAADPLALVQGMDAIQSEL